MGDQEVPISNEQFEQLRTDLLERVNKQDDLEKEILAKLKLKKGIRTFFQHPAVLLALGFLLTSTIGAMITQRWQGLDKKKQDDRLVKENSIKNKNAITDEFSKIAFETQVATSDMLSLYQEGTLKGIENTIVLERMKYWQDTSREWRERSPILAIKAQEQFETATIHQSLEELQKLRGTIGQELKIVTDIMKTGGWNAVRKPCVREECLAQNCDQLDDDAHPKRRIRCILVGNEEFKEKALSTLKEMAKETKLAENKVYGDGPPGFLPFPWF